MTIILKIHHQGKETPPIGAWLPKADCPFCGQDYQDCPKCADHIFVDWDENGEPYFSIECCCGATYVGELN